MNWPLRRPQIPESCKALDLAALEQTLIENHGSLTAAARVLEVPPQDLRKLVSATPALMEAVYDQLEQTIDKAQAIVFKGLRHSDLSKRLAAAKFILRHSAVARRRGWGGGGQPGALKWRD
jgi:hypothetical protein